MLPLYLPKSKLRRGWSYPTGTQALSERFAGLPQAGQLSIRYLREPETPGAVFAAAYSYLGGNPAAWSRRQPPQAHWLLQVYAVQSTHRHAVATALESEGFPRVRAWLARPRPPSWYEFPHRIECIAERGATSLLVKESDN